jgi:hypothetical protein
MAFKIGDMVVRTAGGWRGVEEGDVKKVSSVDGMNIQLEGYPDITFDGENFELSAPMAIEPREFQVGDRVRMISEDPSYGMGELEVGDIGVITKIGGTGYVDKDDFEVDFPNQKEWLCTSNDIEHVDAIKLITLPNISLDVAVSKCQAIRKQIEELQEEAKTYEQVMRKAGVKFI